MDGDRVAALILLPITVVYYTLITLLYNYYRHNHPITDRSSKLSLCRAILLIAASTLLLVHLYAPQSSERLLIVSLFVGLVPASLLVLMRTIALMLRLELMAEDSTIGSSESAAGGTVAVGDMTQSSRASSDDDGGRRMSLPSQRGIGTLQQPRPSTSITLDESAAVMKDGKDGKDGDEDDAKEEAAVAEAWFLQYRWMVEGSFLTCLFSPLLVMSLVGLLLLSLLGGVDVSPASPAVIAVYAAGHAVLLVHWLLLLLCCVRHPAWNEVRAEGVASVVCALILPVSFGLSVASAYTDISHSITYFLAAQYLLLAYYLLTFTSTMLFPLVSALLSTAYLSSSPAVPLQTFVDLIHTSDGYHSFLTFLRTEFSEENLLFWNDVNAIEGKWRELDEVEERRRRRDEKDKEKQALEAAATTPAASTAVSAIIQQSPQPTTTSPAELFNPLLATFATAVNKPLLTLKMSGGLESLSSQSVSSSTARSSDSPGGSQSASRVSSPKSPTRQLYGGSNDVHAASKLSKTRATLQPTDSSVAMAARKSEAISPRSASENGRRVVHNEVHSTLLHDPHADDVFLLPAKRGNSYSNSHSPNRKGSGNAAAAAHTRPVHGSQPPLALTLHPSSIHPSILSSNNAQQQQSAHQRELSVASASYMLPFPVDDSWDLDALSKLRRISWSIALEKKVAKHRASRSRESNGRSPLFPIRAIIETALGDGARGERAAVGSLSMSPRSHTPRRMSPPPAPLTVPLLLPAAAATQSSPRLHAVPSSSHTVPADVPTTISSSASFSSPRRTSAQPSTTATNPVVHIATVTPVIPPVSPSPLTALLTPHSQPLLSPATGTGSMPPQSPSIAKSPFMQSIVRALQATKLSTYSRGGREDDERRRDDERRVVLMRELVRGACDVYDRYIIAGSAQQVNLPAVIVQQVMERMKEINAFKYNKPKLHGGAGGGGAAGGHAGTLRRGGGGGLGGHNGMQHTLGLMRHATMHFLAGAAGGQQKGKLGAKVHPLMAAKQAKAEEEAKKQRELEDAAMQNDVTLLSYPFSQLFADAHHAIEQLMEKDSFKRYLQSPAYEAFNTAYEKNQMTARRRPTNAVTTAAAVAAAVAAGQPSLSRRGSRLAVITPRTSQKVGDIDEGSEEGTFAAGIRRGSGGGGGGGLGARRLSDSVSLHLHIRATPREQRNSLSLHNTPRNILTTNTISTILPQTSPLPRKPLPINSALRMTPAAASSRTGTAGSTASPRRGAAEGGSPAGIGSGRRLELGGGRGSGVREGGEGAATAALVAAAVSAAAGGGGSVSIAVG